MPESRENKRRDYSKFDNMNTEMLEAILLADSQLPDGENSDTDAILYIMEVIAKREKAYPTGKFTDVHNAWASFSENYMPYIEDSKSLYDFENTQETGIRQTPSLQTSRPIKKRRFMRVASIAAAITVLLLASTITASAFGFDLWGTVAKWTRDTFGFSNAATQETPDVHEMNDENEYDSLQNALDYYGITTQLAPTWFPDGYLLDSISVTETPLRTTFDASYVKNGERISVTIISLIKPSTSTYEKDDGEVTVYTTNSIDYYIMTNLNRTNVVWTTENYECSFSGNFSLEEAKKIIDSIYERN
jgi:hypothetical protein